MSEDRPSDDCLARVAYATTRHGEGRRHACSPSGICLRKLVCFQQLRSAQRIVELGAKQPFTYMNSRLLIASAHPKAAVPLPTTSRRRVELNELLTYGRGAASSVRPRRAQSGNAASRLRCGVEHVYRRKGRTVAPEDFELIGQLLLRAGVLMEDRSSELIIRFQQSEPLMAEQVELVTATGRALLTLAAAAETILRTSAK